ncbi:MAG: uroporphyrin-III C-methyltransferase [Acidimicrobiales bacterium]|nr:uroporphyrin-III C-methyltransferase [Acidimicrobiales bacterium]
MSGAPRVAEVALVGAGPGDPDLLTLDAERALAQAATIGADRSLSRLLDSLVAERVQNRQSPVLDPSGHRGGAGPGPEVGRAVRWVDDDGAAEDQLVTAVRTGSGRVVRLYRGDPWFHPAGDGERAALRSAGIDFVTVPGVVEELAVAASAGIPLQVRQLSVVTTFAVDPGQGGPHPSLHLPLDPAHTLVVRTADLRATARRVVESAEGAGLPLHRPAAAVPAPGPRSGAPTVERGSLLDVAERCGAAPGVLVVGLVAALDLTPAPAALTTAAVTP